MKRKHSAIYIAIFAAAAGTFAAIGLGPVKVTNRTKTFKDLDDWPQYTWVEAPQVANRFHKPGRMTTFGDYLFLSGLVDSDDADERTYAFDGRYTINAGTTIGYSRLMWGGGADVFCQTLAQLAVVTYSDAKCPWAFGATVTQAGTGATGTFLSDDATNKQVYVMQLAGATNYTVPGGVIDDGGANTITPTAVTTDGSSAFLEKSDTGLGAYTPVAAFRGDLIPMDGSFVDTGTHATYSNKRILLLFPYGGETTTSTTVQYCVPDDSFEWFPLFSTDVGAIRHFHGAEWVPGLGAGSGTLYVLTGDANNAASILLCADVPHLIQNGSTWKTRWALDQTGAARTTYLTTGAGADYCVGAGGQQHRTVDLVPNATSAPTALYYVPDSPGTAVNYLYKIDTATNTVSQVGKTRATGPGWMGIRQSDGTMLITAGTEATTGTYDDNSDAFARIYAIVNDDLYEIAKYRRPDADATPNGIWALNDLEEFQNYIYVGTAYEPYEWGTVGRAVSSLNAREEIARGRYDSSRDPFGYGETVLNYAPNPKYLNQTSGMWESQNVTIARETTSVDFGQVASYKLTPTGSGASWIRYRPDVGVADALRGRWVTLSVRVLANGFTMATQQVYLQVSSSAGGTNYLLEAASSDWQTLTGTFYCEPGTSNITFIVGARTTGAATNAVYFSDIQIVPSSLAPPRNTPPAPSVLGQRFCLLDGWYQDDVAANQSAVVLTRHGSASAGIVGTVLCPTGGRVVGVGVYSNDARTAGTLTVTPYINGATTSLNASLNATDTTFATNLLRNNTSASDLAPGDRIDIRITTDGTWAPTTADIAAVVWIEQ